MFASVLGMLLELTVIANVHVFLCFDKEEEEEGQEEHRRQLSCRVQI